MIQKFEITHKIWVSWRIILDLRKVHELWEFTASDPSTCRFKIRCPSVTVVNSFHHVTTQIVATRPPSYYTVTTNPYRASFVP